ncbi:hypothetical protein LP123_14325 (plasmid) [Moraxella bovis]|uniref:Uncharacterized protein n=1 Tax=Moraxella bovis TaxID=476 RepID=A0AAQ2QE99_MORBO|nr:hypothetical protein [Moraxella bovis]UYZ77070.1 hypothetical protein LP093_13825 [Moraxella bovis]UYZ79742.1 hypothetical protein LP115_13880 [Moraxella bovis]UYZ82532.1 hypothetical protein LP113_14510 [Moraxella bovis]UYZ88229.1 hypothetical protein LP094_13915 [Moraxella bovis]UYZ93646.1 hypothetical protein LP103_13930 [Moraxella bovis]
MAQKAAANGYAAVAHFKSSNGKDRIYTSSYNGITFRSYLGQDINGNIFIDNVHVVKE